MAGNCYCIKFVWQEGDMAGSSHDRKPFGRKVIRHCNKFLLQEVRMAGNQIAGSS